MKVLDLFSGLGGFSLAAHKHGWETVAFVEKEPFCHKVLNKNFPGVPIHDDIFTFDGTAYRGTVDIVCGGFPCQPFSAAGKRKGSQDERHLFPEMLRVIQEVKPRFVVAENVRGLLNIESGRVFAEVVSCLEGEGFEVVTFCIPASAVGAPHRRDRIWIVAHTTGERSRETGNDCGRSEKRTSGSGSTCDASDSDDERHVGRSEQGQDSEWAFREGRGNGEPFGESAIGGCYVADADDSTTPRHGQNGRRILRESESKRPDVFAAHGWSANWLDVAARTCVRGMADGLSAELDESGSGERGLAGDGRGDGFGDASDADDLGNGASASGTDGDGAAESGEVLAQPESGGHADDASDAAGAGLGSRDNRTARLKALGNSIVWPIAYEIFAAIKAAGRIAERGILITRFEEVK